MGPMARRRILIRARMRVIIFWMRLFFWVAILGVGGYFAYQYVPGISKAVHQPVAMARNFLGSLGKTPDPAPKKLPVRPNVTTPDDPPRALRHDPLYSPVNPPANPTTSPPPAPSPPPPTPSKFNPFLIALRLRLVIVNAKSNVSQQQLDQEIDQVFQSSRGDMSAEQFQYMSQDRKRLLTKEEKESIYQMYQKLAGVSFLADYKRVLNNRNRS